MSPFEVLYGRICKVTLSWANLEDILALGPYMLAQMEEMVWQIKQNLKAAQDKHKSISLITVMFLNPNKENISTSLFLLNLQ